MPQRKDVFNLYFNESVTNCADVFTRYTHDDMKSLKIRLRAQERSERKLQVKCLG